MNGTSTASCLLRLITLGSVLLTAAVGAPAQDADSRGGAKPTAAAAAAKAPGHYYALVIGINDYPTGLPKLKTAVHDAVAVDQVLRERYGLITTLLTDGKATHDAILQALIDYQGSVDENDSVLIYYAGHGFSDEKANKAYWLPADANSSLSVHHIIADELTEDLRNLRARHVLVISDSCYSGGLSRGIESPVLPSKDPAFL